MVNEWVQSMDESSEFFVLLFLGTLYLSFELDENQITLYNKLMQKIMKYQKVSCHCI